jgi:hypothetical protein
VPDRGAFDAECFLDATADTNAATTSAIAVAFTRRAPNLA